MFAKKMFEKIILTTTTSVDVITTIADTTATVIRGQTDVTREL